MNKKIMILGIIVMLSGCASIPDFTEDRQAVIKNSQEMTDYSLSTVSSINTQNWWLDFKDEQLNQLIQKIQANNVDLKIAKLNLEKSQAYYQVIANNDYPTLSFSSSLTREKLSSTGMYPPPYAGAVLNMAQAGLSSSVTLDYLNKNGLLLQEQNKKNEGYKNQIENVELSINIQAIKSYLYYQYLLKEESLMYDRIDLQNQILTAYKSGLGIGKYTESQINEISNESISLKNSLNTLEQNKQTTLNILTQLAGNELIDLNKNDSLWQLKDNMPMSKVDVKLIRQRPDVKYYFSNIEAQRSHFESLKTEFYPSISLTGDLGLQKIGFSDLLNKKSIFWNLGPEITLPIFDAGRIKTNYKVAGIDLNIFIENYNNTIYSAIQEVNSNLIKEKIAYKNLENQQEIFTNQTQNYTNTLSLYNNGKISKLTSIQSNMDLLNNQEQIINSEFNYINSKLEVIHSLGGK